MWSAGNAEQNSFSALIRELHVQNLPGALATSMLVSALKQSDIVARRKD
jgi:hypothetical protein